MRNMWAFVWAIVLFFFQMPIMSQRDRVPCGCEEENRRRNTLLQEIKDIQQKEIKDIQSIKKEIGDIRTSLEGSLAAQEAKRKETEQQFEQKLKAMETQYLQIQEQTLARMHEQLAFNHHLRLLRYTMSSLASQFHEGEIRHSGFQVFTATIPKDIEAFRRKAIELHIQQIQEVWDKLCRKVKEKPNEILEVDLMEWKMLALTYSQISIREDGESQNLLNISPASN